MKVCNIGILILNYNNYNLTIDCVDNLIGVKCKYNILIVDNNSTNKSYEILESRYKSENMINIIKTDYNGGYSYGNNYGIKYLKNFFNDVKYVVIMNPDIKIKNTKIIENIVNIIHNNDEIVMATGLGFTNDRITQASFGWKLPRFKDIIKSNLSFLKLFFKRKILIPKLSNKNGDYILNEVISGCFFAIDIEYLEQKGFLDENVFLYFEENILSKKISDDNLKIAISFNDIYYHNHYIKEKKIEKIKDKLNDYDIFAKSQKYYCEEILGMNLIQIIAIKISVLIHKFIEIPIISLLRGLK